MNEKKLLDEYILLFGDEPPLPPLHIMKTLVDIKNTGTLDEKLDQIQSDLDSFGKKIEDVTGEKFSLENPYFEIDFSQIKEAKISLEECFELITNSFFSKSTQELVETFKKIGMKQMPFQVEESEKDLPEFESGYSFRNKEDNGAEYLFQILDKKNEILQINLQINISKSLFLSNLNKHLKILKDKCDQKFGFSSPMENGEMTTIQYDNELLMIGIQVIKSKNHIIHFKVANKFLWERIFKEE